MKWVQQIYIWSLFESLPLLNPNLTLPLVEGPLSLNQVVLDNRFNASRLFVASPSTSIDPSKENKDFNPFLINGWSSIIINFIIQAPLVSFAYLQLESRFEFSFLHLVCHLLKLLRQRNSQYFSYWKDQFLFPSFFLIMQINPYPVIFQY